MKPYLSKSLFLLGLQCHKALWLVKNRPELMPEPDASLQAIFEAGKDVGKLAQGLFPGGEEIYFNKEGRQKMVDRTSELIKNGAKTTYEATFRHDNILVMVDILHRGKDGWELYEVKSSTEVKDIHIPDITLQYYVLTGAGLPVSKVSLVHINNQYIRKGKINIDELFIIKDLTAEVKAGIDYIKTEVERMRQALGAECPAIDIGTYCDSPFECGFKSHCWAHIPDNSVFDLKERGIDKFEYYRNGIIKFTDLNLDELNYKQRMQIEAEITGKKVINRDSIKEFLNTLRYPLCFLDFETISPAIPMFDNTSPYEKLPFQYSLYCLENETSELKHYEFLAEEGTDQREPLIKGLISLIPDDACVLSYNMTFEKGVLANLADEFPSYRKKLENISKNIVDLMPPFKQRYYYTREMKGSYSLKFVLPALVPELSYNGLAIRDGDAASIAYNNLLSINDKAERERIRRDLLEYCKRDTLGMVRLLEKLREAAWRNTGPL